MATTKSKSSVKQKKIMFEYYAPEAEKVEIAASFNGWDPAKTPLKKEKGGKWKKELSLPSGRHEYRFRVDGGWQNDQRPVECIPNPFGTWNCILEIR